MRGAPKRRGHAYESLPPRRARQDERNGASEEVDPSIRSQKGATRGERKPRGERDDGAHAQPTRASRLGGPGRTSGTGRLRKSTPRYAPRRELLGANGTARAKVLRWSLRLSSGQASRRSRTSTPGPRPSAVTGLPRGVCLAPPRCARGRVLRVDRPEGGPPADLVSSRRRRAHPLRRTVRDVAPFRGREGEDVHDHHDGSERTP